MCLWNSGERKARGDRYKSKTGLKHPWDSPEDAVVLLNAPDVHLMLTYGVDQA